MERIEEQFSKIVIQNRAMPAVSTAVCQVSYETLREKALNLSKLIDQTGDQAIPIGILLPNSVAFLVAVLAVWYSHRVLIAISVNYRKEKVERIIDKLGINTLVADTQGRKLLGNGFKGFCISIGNELTGKVHSGSIIKHDSKIVLSEKHAMVFFTSGTTGTPKIVALTHDNILFNLDSESCCIPIYEKDKTFVYMPMCHSYAFTLQVLRTITTGGHLYLGKANKFSSQLVQEICSSRCTSIYAVPAIYSLILDGIQRTNSYKDIKQVKYLVNGASSMTNKLLGELCNVFCHSDIYLTYGLSEASPLVTCLPPNLLREKGCSIGKAVKGVELQLLTDDHLFTTEVNLVGEIVIRGKSVIQKYINNSAITKKAFVNGFLRTGDIATIDSNGCLYLKGRIKDIINRGGEKIYPEEIEEILRRCRGISEAAVVACPHHVLGEVPYAFVTITGKPKQITPTSIITACSKELAPQKRLIGVEIVESLPRTTTGKICKQKLFNLLRERYINNG